jgi:predicted NBD/HSP70 family sugar kinase
MEKGNEEYKRLFEEFLNTLAYLISNLRTTFTTDIVVCGDIATTIEKYKPQLVNKIDAVALAWKNPESASTFFHANSFERYQASVGAALSLFDDLIETL